MICHDAPIETRKEGTLDEFAKRASEAIQSRHPALAEAIVARQYQRLCSTW
jgi:hypothetical protein